MKFVIAVRLVLCVRLVLHVMIKISVIIIVIIKIALFCIIISVLIIVISVLSTTGIIVSASTSSSICSFVPRLFDFHPDAIPAPYPHSNVDSDEFIFYSKGDFMSRKGISKESITLHPMGLPHGPQPGRYEESIGKKKTEELAVMIDTYKPLHLTKKSLDIEDKDYPLSWNQ